MPIFEGSVRVQVTRRLLRRSALPVVLAALALVAASCHVPGSSSSSGLPAGSQITVAEVAGLDNAPLAVALDDGLFRQQGLTVTVKQVPSVADAYDALQSGSADVAVGDYTSFFYGISTMGAKLTLVMDGYDATAGTMQVLTLPNSGITEPQDLENRVVASPPAEVAQYQSDFPYSVQTLATDAVLQSDGVDPTTVNWKEMPQSEMISALKRHKVAAIVATDPQIIQAETQLGAVEVLDSCSGVTANLPLSGYFSTASFASQHGAELTAFRTALSTAQGDAGLRSAVESVLRGEHLNAQDAALVNIGQYPTFVNVGQVQRVANLMSTSGMIAGTVSVRGLLFQ